MIAPLAARIDAAIQTGEDRAPLILALTRKRDHLQAFIASGVREDLTPRIQEIVDYINSRLPELQ
jgi:hypothetical protein